jgi:hypothetical protein
MECKKYVAFWGDGHDDPSPALTLDVVACRCGLRGGSGCHALVVILWVVVGTLSCQGGGTVVDQNINYIIDIKVFKKLKFLGDGHDGPSPPPNARRGGLYM